MMEKKERRPGDPYEVGFGKPPKRTQFKKGRSGNPYGRPPKKPDVYSELTEVLRENVTITPRWSAGEGHGAADAVATPAGSGPTRRASGGKVAPEGHRSLAGERIRRPNPSTCGRSWLSSWVCGPMDRVTKNPIRGKLNGTPNAEL